MILANRLKTAEPTTGGIVEFVDSFESSAVSGSKDFTGINIGAAASDRNIIIVLGLANLSTITNLTDVSVGGTHLTLYYGTDGGANPIQTIIAAGLVTADNTATVTVTASFCSVFAAVYKYNAPSTTLTLVDNVSNSEASNSNAALSDVEIQSGGVVFYGCSDRASNTTSTVSWTGADSPAEGSVIVGARTLHHGYIICTESTTTDDLTISIGGTDKVARQAVSFI